MLNYIASEINLVRNKSSTWKRSLSWPLNLRPAAKIRFALQHNLPARATRFYSMYIQMCRSLFVRIQYCTKTSETAEQAIIKFTDKTTTFMNWNLKNMSLHVSLGFINVIFKTNYVIPGHVIWIFDLRNDKILRRHHISRNGNLP